MTAATRMKPLFLIIAIATLIGAADASDLRLWYDRPAKQWTDALPIGNGRLGAMVFGGTEKEHLQLNEDTFWAGEPLPLGVPDVKSTRNMVVELLKAEKFAEAETFMNENWLGRCNQMYQPLVDLYLTFPDDDDVTNYERELDLETAIARVRYEQNGATFTREYFSSHPANVIVIHLTCDQPGRIDCMASFDSIHPTAKSAAKDDDTFVVTGQAPGFVTRRGLDWIENVKDMHKYPEAFDEDGKRRPGASDFMYGDDVDGKGMFFDTRVRASVLGGKLRTDDTGLHIEGADSATLVIAAGTSFNGFDKSPSRDGVDPAVQVLGDIAAIEQPYDTLQSDHVADYQALFNRVTLDLGTTDQATLPTDERVVAFKDQDDPALVTLLFQYGRYLIISGSRPGTQPLNLQGIWNNLQSPPWSSNYTTNINTEMNYWPAEVTNLAECHEPLFDLIRDAAVNGAVTARESYGARGWLSHHNLTLWRNTDSTDNEAKNSGWPMAGAWLCQHLWERYQFSGDERFLRDTAYPLMKGAALFCIDWLVEDEDGFLVTPASSSPESRFIGPDGEPHGIDMGTTIDMAIDREIMTRCLWIAKHLDIDPEFQAELEKILPRLLPYQISEEGYLQEWRKDFEPRDWEHRHLSQLYGLHPGGEITLRGTPEWATAACKTLEKRGYGGTGWSLAWKISLWARLEEGDRAYRFIRNQFNLVGLKPARRGGGVYRNLFGAHPPFQMDSNFGVTAGVAEMLLRSHADAVHLLPALPSAWPSGKVTGLRARGGYEVDMEWADGKLLTATIKSAVGNPLIVRHGDEIAKHETEAGKTYTLNGDLAIH